MKDILKLLKLYPGIKNKIFVFFKWLIFPFENIEKYLPKQGEIVDIGCGEGVLSIYLSYKERKRYVYGIDFDKDKIVLAKKAGQGFKNLEFKISDALSWDKRIDGLVISDTFHHFPRKTQELFLKKAATLLKKRGVLVIKEINKDDLIRSKLSRFWDFILYPKDEINYWSILDFKSRLKALGFQVSVKREAILFPGSTILYICSKK